MVTELGLEGASVVVAQRSVVLAARAAGTHPLADAVNTVKDGEDGERDPAVVLPDKVGNAVGRSDTSLEVEVDREEGNIGEGAGESRLGGSEDEVTSLGLGEDLGAGSGDVGSANRAEVVGEREDVAPETVVREQRGSKLAVTGDGGALEGREPLLGSRANLVLAQLSSREEAGLVSREVGGEGEGAASRSGEDVCGHVGYDPGRR